LTLLVPSVPKFKNGELATVLGALSALYVPIQFREDVPEKAKRIESLNISWAQKDQVQKLINTAITLESGLFVSRDIGGGDPERMAPPFVADYVVKSFTSGVIKVSVIDDQDRFVKEFPLFAAVNRASRNVQRHQGRIIFLEYKPPKPARKTLMLVGKGVTYDTGGADIKVRYF
jgi:leucyl aminopeptidase